MNLNLRLVFKSIPLSRYIKRQSYVHTTVRFLKKESFGTVPPYTYGKARLLCTYSVLYELNTVAPVTPYDVNSTLYRLFLTDRHTPEQAQVLGHYRSLLDDDHYQSTVFRYLMLWLDRGMCV